MKIPILNGVYTDEGGDYRARYPRNHVPVPLAQGISKGYLRPADGIELLAASPGVDRGGINWNDITYRVCGGSLVRVNANGTVDTLGYVSGVGQCTLDYSPNRLGIVSGGNLYYWNAGGLVQVTDANLGYVRDMVWYEGYFVCTDGNYIIVTELADPMTVKALKYASAETDPDPIMALFEIRNEVNVVGRYTIEFFDNVGGSNFPLSRIKSAQIMRGAVGTHACCEFMQAIAFVGGAHNEPPSVYLGANATALSIATREIDDILQTYTEDELSAVVLESKIDRAHQHLYVHLPDRTMVYDSAASAVAGERVWFELGSTVVGSGKYLARNFVWCYGQWICGDPSSGRVGRLSKDVSSHYGELIGWDFGTVIVYNEGNGAIFHELELVGLTGRAALGADPTVWSSYSDDGETFSQEQPTRVFKNGQRGSRAAWLGQGAMGHYRVQRFRGTSDAHMSIAALQIRIEPLNN